jgi:F420-non-reducing hydrogenase iron-sulfur subunit
MSAEQAFKPRILGIICNWCCYGGADLCGVSRFQYPPYLRVVRLMCSGRVEMEHIFQAFSNGSDGVFIGGCHLNDCHYNTEGNHDCIAMVLLCKSILEQMGVDPARLRLEWVSAAEGARFASVMNDFSTKIENLGPLGKGEGLDKEVLKANLAAGIRIIPYIKLMASEKLRVRFKTEEEYYQFFNSEGFNRLFEETILEKFTDSQISSLLRKGSLKFREIANIFDITPSEVSKHMNNLIKKGIVKYKENEKCYSIA